MDVLVFLCSRSLNNPSVTSSLNSSFFSTNLSVFSISLILVLSSSSFPFIFARVTCFIKKLSSPIRSDTLSNSWFLAPLKVSEERFLYNSVSAYFAIDDQRPKNIPSEQRKCRETIPCDFVSLHIWCKFSRFIFSVSAGTSQSNTIINSFVKVSLPLR